MRFVCHILTFSPLLRCFSTPFFIFSTLDSHYKILPNLPSLINLLGLEQIADVGKYGIQYEHEVLKANLETALNIFTI